MPTVVKHIFKFYSQAGYGWSEVHYTNPSTTGLNLQSIIDYNEANIIPARVALLGKDCGCVGQRVSFRIVNGIASLGRRKLAVPDLTYDGADSSSSLAIVFQNNDGTKKKVLHMRGWWDDLVRNEVVDPPPAVSADWDPRFLAWVDALKAGGFGWLTRDTTNSAKGDVTNYVFTADGRVTFTVVGNAQLTALINQTVSVNFSKLNGSKSTLNRALVCLVKDATTIETVAPISAGAFTGRGKYSVRLTTFVGYSTTGSISPGERRMGKPLDRLAGRAKARART